ncbi:MAG: monovalent cation/H(+) antiporter subunit G [Pseudohongiella sp.]|nr:monovalent cation/H(+) antiporter subunit G [Pseudohongiella sp.]MDP2284050.1 monovalent cation/H(+) antiporter subunit G [Pseudohongiella sp.]
MTILDILSGTLLLAGCALGVIGAIGLIRFPDFYTRMHAAGVTDTLCAGLFLGGLAIQFGMTLASAKLLLIFLFMLFTCPTSSHALAKAARHGGLKPWTKAGSDGLDAMGHEGAKSR